MGGELVKPASLSYTKQFKASFPFYLSIGMTYDQFWDGDCTLVEFYRKAYSLREARDNRSYWMQGLYFYDALCAVSPVLHAFAKAGTKPQPYLKEPYPISEEECERRADEARREKLRNKKLEFKNWAAGLKIAKRGSEERDADDRRITNRNNSKHE